MTDLEYQGFRPVGGRLSEPLRPELNRHQSRLMVEKLEALHAFDKAHAVMLVEEGLIDREHGRSILGGLRTMERAGVVEARLEAEGGLHSGEQYLTNALGPDIGGRVHLGRSSADLAGVSRRIVTRERLLEVLAELNGVRQAIVDTAAATLDVVMPAYTHGQHAQPTTYAHWLSMWATVFGRDFTRVRAAFDGINRSPAGAAAVIGSDFALNRDRTAHLLGFGDVLVNTMDATLSNDAFVECVLAVRVLAANIGRLAEDLLFWTTAEAGMMRVPDRFCDTSSIMAQKRNPSVLHQMRALSLHAGAAMTAALEAEAGQTGQAVLARKVAEDAAWVLLSHTVQRLNEVADLIPSLTLDPERMLALAEGDWSQATDVAGSLVREAGLSWRAAHQIVGILVKNCEDRGVHPTRVTVELVHEAACQYGLASIELSAEGLASAVSARDCVGRRTGIGGPAPDRVRADLDAVRTRLDADRSGVDDYLRQLAEGAAALDDAVTAILE